MTDLATLLATWRIDLPFTVPPWLAHSDLREWLLVLLAPVFLLTVLVEWLHLRRRDRQAGPPIYELRDALDSLNLGGVYMLLDVVIVLTLVLPAMTFVYGHRLTTIDITPWTFAALFLGVEFCYYVFHRASHRIRWFWCAHVVHHGSEHMNFTTAMRQSWLYSFAGNWLFYTPLVWLGFEPRWVLFALAINLAYQFFVHTQWIAKLPAPIEFIFNTPSHHRAHHGRNPRYIDKNYGGTLIIFDRLFGTFVPETEAPDYGLVRQVHSHNPIWLTIHEWVAMLRDMARPGPWSERLKHLWAPPEWERTRDNPAHASERPPRPHHATRP
ncbi:sterol desaturase family protein [Aquabacterium sp. G14]|uniref:sterol desaturase family protein n=1 Tax=Aquabacterium sp. G14 TaxID=3130164 RepID=UPI0030AC624C